MAEPTTTIRVRESTKRRLELLGTMGDSFDSLINRIADEREKGKETAGETRSVPGIFHDVFPVDEAVEILSKPTRQDVHRVLKDDRGTV